VDNTLRGAMENYPSTGSTVMELGSATQKAQPSYQRALRLNQSPEITACFFQPSSLSPSVLWQPQK